MATVAPHVSPSQRVLPEDEVHQALTLLSDSAIRRAADHGLNPAHDFPRTHPQVIVTALSLCLYYAALDCDTTPPGIELPHQPGRPIRRLHSATCPPGFAGWFRRWSGLVHTVRWLPLHEKYQLENHLSTYSDYDPVSYPPHIHNMAQVLRDVAQNISGSRTIRPQHSYTMPANDINTHPLWAPSAPHDMNGSAHNTIRQPAPQHPGRSRSVYDYPLSESPSHDSNAQAFLSPPESNASHSPVSPGTLPARQPFVGGFACNAPQPLHSQTLPLPSPAHSQASLLSNGSPPNTANQPVTPHTPHAWVPSGFQPNPDQLNPHFSPITIRPPNHQPPPRPYSDDSQSSTPWPYSPEDMFRPPVERPIYDSQDSSRITPPERGPPSLITSHTSVAEVIELLGAHRCEDLTHYLDLFSIPSDPVSRGGYGVVYRARLMNGMDVALKILSVLPRIHDEQPKDLKHTALELHTWSKCKHQNIAPLLGLAEFKGKIAMVSPWMENGNLREYVKSNPHVNRLELSIRIADALAHLHSDSVGIVHGDLKGDNVLVSKDGTPFLIDFGCSAVSERTIQFTSTKTKSYMTVRWSAPEIMNEDKVSRESDVYALGMIILEAFTGTVPYATIKTDAAVITAVTRGNMPERPLGSIPAGFQWSDMLWDCLVACWRFRPHERPTAAQVRDSLLNIPQQRQNVDRI